MPLSLAEAQAISEIGQLLYDFLPGSPHPYADQNLSFPGVAHSLGLSDFWRGGSKLPALTQLLQQTLDARRGLFCDLILEIVRGGMIYRNSKHKPITREEIQELNNLLVRVHFKIPDLWEPAFLDSLTSEHAQEDEPKRAFDSASVEVLRDELVNLKELAPKQRGFAFERFLNSLFSVHKLNPRRSFRLVGEQIDGSFQVGSTTYLLEAKWQNKRVGQSDLLVFREKVESKSMWGRGLFVSYSGFTPDGLQAFARGRPTNIIGMNGQDLYFLFESGFSLKEVINLKVRRATETGEFYVAVFDLVRGM